MIIILFSWLALTSLLRQQQQDAIDAEIRQNHNIARALREQTVRVIATADQALLRVEQAVLRENFNSLELEQFANETGMVPNILTQISEIGPDGIFIGSNIDPDGSKTGHIDLSEREHVAIHLWPERVPEARKLIMTDGLFVGRPVLGKVSNKQTFQLSRKVTATDGKVLAVLVASLDVSYFQKIYAGVDLGKLGGVTLAGEDGVVRVRVIGGVSRDTSSLVPRERFQSPEGDYQTTSAIDQVERIVAYQSVAPYPLYVFVTTSKSEALANWGANRSVLITMTAILDLAVLVATGILLSSIRRLEAKNQALEKSERDAQTANAAKTEFLAAMSHELRTPLTSILGYSELMESRLEDKRYKETAGLIRKSANYLNTLLSEILDFSKIEASAMELNNASHNLRAVVFEITNLFRIGAFEKGLTFECVVADDVPEILICDILRFKQILNNLLSNAIKFTHVGKVSIFVEFTENRFKFHVTDTGPGIELDKQQQVFERFRQGDASVSYQHGGTGLGLALARGLAERMNGTLVLQSVLGSGARFTLTLPKVNR